MTESEWSRCTDPTAMLTFLRDRGPSERKLRLFGFFEPDGTPTENFDLMSYCFTDEAHTWISGLNWTRAVSRVASATGSTAAQTAGAARPRPATALAIHPARARRRAPR